GAKYAPPPRTQRQVNASAQTSERYIPRSNSISGCIFSCDVEEICTCHHSSISESSHGGSISDLNDVDELDNGHICSKDGGADLSYNIMHNLSISEDATALSDCIEHESANTDTTTDGT
ncbi:hypothetical protein EVAR_101573_1, partial [Eumeta japonica]